MLSMFCFGRLESTREFKLRQVMSLDFDDRLAVMQNFVCKYSDNLVFADVK